MYGITEQEQHCSSENALEFNLKPRLKEQFKRLMLDKN